MQRGKPLQRRTPLKQWASLRRAPFKVKSINALLGEGKVFRASTFTGRPKPIRKRAKRKVGELSQVEVFQLIWEDRPHVSQISGLPLVPEPDDKTDELAMKAWIRQFSHLLPKGTYRRLKSDQRNIWLKTSAEHDFWERHKVRSARAFKEAILKGQRPPGTFLGWQRCCNQYQTLIAEANGVQ